jgi:hypothetical protein
MTKRSHEIASRQAEVARERKRKRKLQLSRPAAPVTTAGPASDAEPISRASGTLMGSSSTQPVQTMTAEEMQSRYVKRDLRLIAFITIPIVIVLIVLAIVL